MNFTPFPQNGTYDIIFLGSDFISPMLVHDIADGFVLLGWGELDQPLTGNPYVDQIEGNNALWISVSQIAAVVPADFPNEASCSR